MRKYLLPGFLLISDILIIIAAAIMSVYIRFEGADVDHYLRVIVAHLPFLIVDFLLFFLFFELYRRVWRYAGIRELLAVAGAALCGTAAFYVGHNLFDGVYIPRTLYVLIFFMVLAGTGISRLALRFLITLSSRENKTSEAIPVLIIGAGDAGNLMARDIKQYHANDRHIVGFIDDDPSKLHNLAFGIKVLGGRDVIASAVEKYGVKEIIIAMPSLTPREIAAIVDICSQTKCITKIVPGVYSLLEQNVNMNTLRPVGVEDLLERDPVILDVEKIAGYLKGKCVMVTGAGGSIGSELCRQVMQMKPSTLILLGKGENSIYEIHREQGGIYGTKRIVPIIASVRDTERMAGVFDRYKPQVVFHAAAHKHVPLMEAQPEEAVRNNVSGSWSTARLAGEKGVETFIMVSTDKAVNPTSVMGATKRVAEKVMQGLNVQFDTKYITVRFGNVLGSRGSVVPLFKKQIEAGGPVTVTDPEMKRYFMTIPEASQLILQAGAMGKGGEVFVLDMGEPVKIVDLARNMIRLYGHEPDGDIQITFTGL
ncbi:MAG: nucleoside-diphosphate sugar epimerase/dehydratase, partial [Clostridiaceae bacterium]|nr:nucleoside-diphosphate sugar epimerase/dehydratase [Clostridiaceae bacterium]